MKKLIALMLVSVLLLSAMISLITPISAADEEGIFNVLLSEDSERMTEEQKPPVPGYYYDETGFHTSSNGFKNFNPKFTVVSKEMYDIKNFTMTVVIHDYSVAGDNWFSFTLWSESNGFAMGDTSGEYGDGWTSIIRAREDGVLNRFESWNQTKGKRSGVQVFSNIDNTQTAPLIFEPNVNEETGDITITFAIVDGSVSVNGKVVGENTDKVISDRFKDGMAYVGITLYNSDSSGEHNPTVSITDINGLVPTGSDSREAEDKVRKIAEIADSASIPANTPALWFDGTLEKTNNSLPADTRYCNVSFSDDNQNYRVTAENHVFYMQLDVPDSISYNASDFTYVAAIFKNYCTCSLADGESAVDYCTNTAESLHIRYCAGNVTAPNDDCIQKVESFYNVSPEGSTDLYTVAVLPVEHVEWQGRINAIRLDFGNFESFFGVEGRNTFEVMFVGVFKSGTDVMGFVKDFRDMNLDIESMVTSLHNCEADGCIDLDKDGYCDACWSEMPEISDCDHVDEDADEVCDNCGANLATGSTETETETDTGAGDTTVAPDANDGTEAPTTEKTDDTSDEKGGCGSVVSMGALAIVAIVGTGLVIKKKED